MALTGVLMIAVAGPAAADTTLSIESAHVAGTEPDSPLVVRVNYMCKPGEANEVMVTAEVDHDEGEVSRGWTEAVCDGEFGPQTIEVPSFAEAGGDPRESELDPSPGYRKGQKLWLTVELLKTPKIGDSEVVDTIVRHVTIE
ncbi:hypothetical protein ACH474_33480 [Nocardia rhamnosiphila]|uniref:hypothetical protein n=1 Tax=Nocardia rhamnosiphila TaxID=426716 RepID=UPI0004C36104|nr:hypothetical protein [Nocardia rhamnosiphila]